MKNDEIPQKNTHYCLHIGDNKIYGITTQQLQKLYQTILMFIEKDEALANSCIDKKNSEEKSICIEQNTTLYADDDDFITRYFVNSHNIEIQDAERQDMYNIAFAILKFLNQYDNQSGKDSPNRLPAGSNLNITTDCRTSQCSTPYVKKIIELNVGESAPVYYYISINNIASPKLSFNELTLLMQEIGNFLQKQ